MSTGRGKTDEIGSGTSDTGLDLCISCSLFPILIIPVYVFLTLSESMTPKPKMRKPARVHLSAQFLDYGNEGNVSLQSIAASSSVIHMYTRGLDGKTK
jgi:hypothetical protein